MFSTSVIRECYDVKQEALTLKQVVHFARVHGIIVEKNYQLPESDERRKFKGRGVLLGNKIKNQNWEAACFQDLGNSPASCESSSWADFYGRIPGHSVKLADAIQACIQAQAASSSYRAQAHEREHHRKGEGKGKSYGHAGGRTWEQTNNYARDWKPAAMNMNSYGATFRDATWTRPRHRRDPGYWNEPYWNPNIRTTRRSWQEWYQDREEERHEHGEQHHEENDTWQEQG